MPSSQVLDRLEAVLDDSHAVEMIDLGARPGAARPAGR
jgi:hypothetical protein